MWNPGDVYAGPTSDGIRLSCRFIRRKLQSGRAVKDVLLDQLQVTSLLERWRRATFVKDLQSQMLAKTFKRLSHAPAKMTCVVQTKQLGAAVDA